MVIILFLYLFKIQFRSNSLSSISIVNVLTWFPLDLMAYEATYNTSRKVHTTPRIKIDTLINVFWSSFFGFNTKGGVFVKIDSLVLKYESLDRVIVFVAFFDADCGVFDAEVWKNVISKLKEIKFIFNFQMIKSLFVKRVTCKCKGGCL